MSIHYKPLAEEMRPEAIEDILGQEHLIGQGKIITELISNNEPFSAILWGPPGSGKTTLARVLAREIYANFVELSAVNALKKDVMKVIEDAKVNARLGMKTILFVDEIHRFNKGQQDAFLPYVENGVISLIGATTENPSFEVITPLLSRSRVIVLKAINKSAMQSILTRAIQAKSMQKQINNDAIEMMADIASGDARLALGVLELTIKLAKGNRVTPELVKTAAQTQAPRYDKNGDGHHNVISAFIKSMRGSDANATLYYLARMLNAGEDPKFIARRMVIFASEDIGIASSPALNLAISTFQAVERIGMPECQYNLFHCALVLSKSAKSRVVADAMHKALDSAASHSNLEVPLHIRNAPTKMMQELGYGKDYRWQANYKPSEGFLPTELSDLNLF